jgi:hypothetical protein
MQELSASSIVVALAIFVVIAVVVVRMIPRVMGRQCPKCLRRVPKGETTCPACGAAVLK